MIFDAEKSIHLAATGSLNSNLATMVPRSKIVKRISANDEQRIENENVLRTIPFHSSDVGSYKVHALERHLHLCFPELVVEPIVASNESGEIDPYLKGCDLIISAANTVPARQAIARKALLLQKPVIDIGVSGRARSQITVLLNSPEMNWGACCGCFFTPAINIPPDDGLSPLDVILAAAFGAKLAVEYLTNSSRIVQAGKNFWLIETPHRFSAMCIDRRSDCTICG